MTGISDIKKVPIHPDYANAQEDWFKFRKVLDSGNEFINEYLAQLSNKESVEDYNLRKRMTYNPSFALAALNDIKNSIVQRMPDVVRSEGSKYYLEASKGFEGGVTKRGHDMNGFLAEEVLLELLGMSCVGVYIDAPQLSDSASIEEAAGKRPYLYTYCAEDILNWKLDSLGKFSKLLLRHIDYEYDETFDLPKAKLETYRLFELVPTGVQVYIFDSAEDLTNNNVSDIINLDLEEIPFVLFKLPYSLLKDTANYQIALMNLCSSDLLYAYKGNFPFYIEQYDAAEEESYKRSSQLPNRLVDPNSNIVANVDTEFLPTPGTGQTEEVVVGPLRGRRYPKNTDPPAFIGPSTEPLKASLDLRKELKDEIRLLTNLSVAGLAPRNASAALKSYDQDSVESGISFIAGIIQAGERRLAKIWGMYEGTNEVAHIVYPTTYSIKTTEERLTTAKELSARIDETPSLTAKKQMAKKVLEVLFNTESTEVLAKMKTEIDTLPNIVINPDALKNDIEATLVGNAMASQIRGYPIGEDEVAKKDHAERIARIQAAQSNDRDGSQTGNPDAVIDPNAAKKEKEESQDANRSHSGKPVRGRGKSVNKQF